MPKIDPNPVIADEVPWDDHVTSYDEAHFVVYLRLLDASAANATDADMCRIILDIDPVREPMRARRALDSHMRRAVWMTKEGYRDLLRRDGISGDHLKRLM